MRYNITKQIVVRSENAAKPLVQRSKYLHQYISSLPTVRSSFDLGCGKLRYAESILSVSNSVSLVDSEIQISRSQLLGGASETSIRNICNGSNTLRCFNIDEFENGPDIYDRGFCLNVLPIIPFESERNRVVSIARSKLSRGSMCYFVHHFRNKEYRRMRHMENAFPFEDGFVIKSLRGHSFFAALGHEYTAALIERGSFRIVSRRLIHGACYLEAEAS